MLQRVFLLSIFLVFSTGVHSSPASDADRVTKVLFEKYWDSGRQDFGANNYWFYAHSIDIAAMAVSRNASPESKAFLDLIISAQRKRGFLQGKDVYFDDEAWMAISLARASEVTGNAVYLADAKILLADILKRGTEGRSNGVWWNSEHQKVATAANAGTVIAAALLGEIDFAKKNYAFWKSTMVDPESFLIYDQILGTGAIDKTPWSYDQGLMIGAAVELFRITGDESYLSDARNFASYMLKKMKSSSGIMVEEVCVIHRECIGWKDVAQFKGIAFRYLVELLKVDPLNTELREYLTVTAESIMSPAVFDEASGKFAFEWDGSADPATGYYQTANSAVLAIAAFATL